MRSGRLGTGAVRSQTPVCLLGRACVYTSLCVSDIVWSAPGTQLVPVLGLSLPRALPEEGRPGGLCRRPRQVPALRLLLCPRPGRCCRWGLPAPPGRALALLWVQPSLSGCWLPRTRPSSWSVLPVVRRGQTASPGAVAGARPSLQQGCLGWGPVRPQGTSWCQRCRARVGWVPGSGGVWRQLAWGGRASAAPARPGLHAQVLWRWCPWSRSLAWGAVWPRAPGHRARPRASYSHRCSHFCSKRR